jgi:hypothetical protein
MAKRRFGFGASAVIVVACVGSGCTGASDGSTGFTENDGAVGIGGRHAGSGGASSPGGQRGASGSSGGSGPIVAGGSSGNGGISSGGSSSSGGKIGGGGEPSTGGRSGSGGSLGNGGAPSTGGVGGVGGGGTGGTNGTGGMSGSGEPPELAGILAAHNTVRAAKGLKPLTWDPALAKIAHDWVVQCVDTKAPTGLVDHNANRSSTYPEYVGENIYASSGTATGPAAVNSWKSEEANYNYAANTCSADCGHYTQIVWAKTTKVGCALYKCTGLTYSSTVVCDYAPGGNINGQKPY